MEHLSHNHFRCSYGACFRGYSTKTNLRRHVRINHLSLHTYSCPLCSKALHSRQTMREHMNRHTGMKPFICLEINCGKQFMFSSQLSIHRKGHFSGMGYLESYQPTPITLPSPSEQLPEISTSRQRFGVLPLHPLLSDSSLVELT